MDTLAENVKRGDRTKREKVWYPGRPPIGYLNGRADYGAKIIMKNPDRLPLVKRLWELFLTGQHSVSELAEIAARDFGLRTRSTFRRGTRLFSPNPVLRILGSPFYTGNIVYEGTLSCQSGQSQFAAERHSVNRTL